MNDTPQSYSALNHTPREMPSEGELQPGLEHTQNRLTSELDELEKRISVLTGVLYDLRVDDFTPEENVQAKEPLPPMSPAMDRVQGHINTVRAMQYQIYTLLSTLRI